MSAKDVIREIAGAVLLTALGVGILILLFCL